jgi:RNA polymerase sigma-70 factor, ECF subfamily
VSEQASQRPSTLQVQSLDQEGFGMLVEPHRRELKAHCYRMMGSVQDAEDMVQETFLRAWRRRDTFEGRASFRAWLYRIATNVCLDTLKRRPRRAVPVTRQSVSTLVEPIPPSVMEPVWLEPYPDDLLTVGDSGPEGQFSARENITLAFIAALHLLPPRQRAVLILRDVLDWQANEVAELLDMTVSAVKSALHRARTTLASHDYAPDTEPDAARVLNEVSQAQLEDYVRAWETADVDALLRLLKDDATFSMPPIPSWYRGRETIGGLTAKTVFSGQANGRWRLLPTRANGQTAFGLYRQTEYGGYAAYGIQVLTFDRNLIADIITFRSPDLFPHFKLPATLD